MESSTRLATTVVGTPLSFSPELCRGEPYNAPSDMWGLGCVLHELMTLRPPFAASNVGAVVAKIMAGRRKAPQGARR